MPILNLVISPLTDSQFFVLFFVFYFFRASLAPGVIIKPNLSIYVSKCAENSSKPIRYS